MVELIHEAQGAVAQFAALRFVEVGKIIAQQCDRTGCRGIQSAQKVQKRRFAGTGSADDGDAFSFGDGETDAGEDFDGVTALPEGFAQSFAGQDGFIHSAVPPPG